MRTRQEIEKDINNWTGVGKGEQQQIVASVVAVELLLDIRDLLSTNEKRCKKN